MGSAACAKDLWSQGTRPSLGTERPRDGSAKGRAAPGEVRWEGQAGA